MNACENKRDARGEVLEAVAVAEDSCAAAAGETLRAVPLLGADAGAAGCRVLHLEAFEPACTLAPSEADAYERRFVTLLQEPGAPRAGGLGSVVRVSNLWGEVFALKVLALPDEEAFRAEYRLQRAVSGLEGFPRVYGCGRLGDERVLVMEWVEGVTLAKAARILAVDDDERVSPLVAARIGRDLFELVARMRFVEGGIAHRDISSGNVMVRTDRLSLDEQVDEGAYDLCLVDFGSAATVDAAEGAACEAHRGATADFAAPELLAGADGRAATAAADVYAAASVVWMLATGEPPFGAAESHGAAELREAKIQGAEHAWRTVHAGDDVAAALLREPEVAVAVRRAAADLTPAPAPAEAAAALCAVDAALESVLRACLDPDLAARPDADQVRDALGSFSFHYAENVGRALRGEPAVPLAPGGLADGYGGAAQRRRTVVRVVGKALSAVVGVSALAAAGAIAGLGAGLASLGLSAGVPSGIAAAAVVALPPIGGALARLRARGAAGLVRAAVGVAAGAAIALAAGAAASLPGDAATGLAAALLASAGAAWCYCAMDFVAPAPGANARQPHRAKPASAALPQGAAEVAGELGAGERADDEQGGNA